MTPDKFEKLIKTGFEKREIKPSEESWNRLKSQLDARETQGSRSIFWYSSVAAVLILILSGVFYTHYIKESNVQVSSKPQEHEVDAINPELEPSVKLVLEKPSTEQEKNSDKVKVIINNRSNKTGSFANRQISSENLVQKKESRGTIKVRPVLEVELEKPGSAMALIAMENQANVKGEPDVAVTDAEIEMLLANAQLQLNRNSKTSEIELSADELLAIVEVDLDHSFRKEVLEFLKQEISKARTALASKK